MASIDLATLNRLRGDCFNLLSILEEVIRKQKIMEAMATGAVFDTTWYLKKMSSSVNYMKAVIDSCLEDKKPENKDE